MRLLLPVVLMAGVAFAQEGYRKHNFMLNAGAGVPRGDLRNLLSTSAGVGVLYGYRFHPYFQVEGGYETLFGAADVRDFLPTSFGNLRIRDYQQFVPFGGRVLSLWPTIASSCMPGAAAPTFATASGSGNPSRTTTASIASNAGAGMGSATTGW